MTDTTDGFRRPAAPIRAVAFDMDGLLATSEDVYLEVGTETLRRRGKSFEDDLRAAMMGLPAPRALQVMIDWHGLDDTVEELARESEQTFWELAGDGIRPMPAARERIAQVDSAGLPRGVVTSGTRDYAARVLDLIGVREGMRFVITADDVTHGKPDPEPYCRAIEAFGVQPHEMIVLEDSSNGCRAGIAAGAYTVAVPSPHTRGYDFTGVAFVAETLADPRLDEVLRGA